ncbi:MAG: hypothetical protein KatS3mg101_0991 [Patescibacteria group bacterium]|nr:MAG: hypothetical protein KatS3mg101_0991 [Patescibacteria group bacterium]
MRERECQAPVHNPRCPCQSCQRVNCGNCRLTNIDHFTPKCIAKKILHWSSKQINAPENLQYLSIPCHTDKDRTTPDRLRLAIRQKRGEFISLEDYKKIL